MGRDNAIPAHVFAALCAVMPFLSDLLLKFVKEFGAYSVLSY
ncbi:hypothetical protein D083_3431 [Dickeya solani RNS 08.23.3.1.A]|nr:hypothetical protein D083_3431 [Dickeya solani RNS 08.23.3.1.A]